MIKAKIVKVVWIFMAVIMLLGGVNSFTAAHGNADILLPHDLILHTDDESFVPTNSSDPEDAEQSFAPDGVLPFVNEAALPFAPSGVAPTPDNPELYFAPSGVMPTPDNPKLSFAPSGVMPAPDNP